MGINQNCGSTVKKAFLKAKKNFEAFFTSYKVAVNTQGTTLRKIVISANILAPSVLLYYCYVMAKIKVERPNSIWHDSCVYNVYL